MMRALLAILLLLAGLGAARADFSRAALEAIAAEPRPDTQLPLATQFEDSHGAARTLNDAIGNTPAVIVFADYTCRTLCGPILAFAAGALEKTGLAPGRDYHLVVVGIDPKDDLATASAFEESHIGKDTPLADQWDQLHRKLAIVLGSCLFVVCHSRGRASSSLLLGHWCFPKGSPLFDD